MSAKFKGFKTISGGKVAKAVANWVICPGDDPAAGFLNNSVPWLASNLAFVGWAYTLDLAAQQSSFTFGTTQALNIAIQRRTSFYEVAGNFNRTGRTVVYIPSSGQVFAFAPKQFVIGAVPNDFECESCVVPVFSADIGTVIVYVEADTIPGGFSTNSLMQINLGMYNFPIPPVTV